MSEVIKENGTFFEIAARAAEYAAEKGKVSEKKLAKALGIRMPTASKTVCALALMGVLGKKDGRYYSVPRKLQHVQAKKAGIDYFAGKTPF